MRYVVEKYPSILAKDGILVVEDVATKELAKELATAIPATEIRINGNDSAGKRALDF
jgi:hypothetical protein